MNSYESLKCDFHRFIDQLEKLVGWLLLAVVVLAVLVAVGIWMHRHPWVWGPIAAVPLVLLVRRSEKKAAAAERERLYPLPTTKTPNMPDAYRKLQP
jgi:hypothetical protein